MCTGCLSKGTNVSGTMFFIFVEWGCTIYRVETYFNFTQYSLEEMVRGQFL